MTELPDAGSNERVEHVVLVDASDRPIGQAEKISAHQDGGRLHRAFSIFLFHPDGRMLLQRRSQDKYHFRGLWTNACCGHPRPGEETSDAARRRLREELGIECPIEKVLEFAYRATDPRSRLTEHEYDHVFMGIFAGDPVPDPLEVGEWKWMSVAALRSDLEAHPDRYTPWLPIALDRLSAIGPFLVKLPP